MRPAPVAAMALLALFGTAGAVGARHSQQTQLSPTITPWHAVGGIGIGMVRAAVEYRYGTAPGEGTVLVYTVPGGTLFVQYHHARVTDLETNSRFFRTEDGFGIGSTIPLGRCHRIAGRCRYTWRSFTLNPNPYVPDSSEWQRFTRWGAQKVAVSLRVSQGGVVNDIQIAVWPPHGCARIPPYPAGEC